MTRTCSPSPPHHPSPLSSHHRQRSLGIPQVWSNVGRLRLSKLIRNVPVKWGRGGGICRPRGETQHFIVLLPLHSTPHLSPLKKNPKKSSHPSSKHKPPLFFSLSFLPAVLPNHLTWLFFRSYQKKRKKKMTQWRKTSAFLSSLNLSRRADMSAGTFLHPLSKRACVHLFSKTMIKRCFCFQVVQVCGENRTD